jgi:inorganic triphosphatase YgiF
VLVDIANIRSKMNSLFPVSRLRTSLPSLSLLKTLAPELAACSDHEFIEQFTQQISTERREVAVFLSSLSTADKPVPSLSAASSEFLRLHDSLQSLQREHHE